MIKKRFNRGLAWALTAALLLPGLNFKAVAVTTDVAYVNAAGVQQTPKTATIVDSSTTDWSSGVWYVVNTAVTIDTRIAVTGGVNLILADGGSLTANVGINVTGIDSLTIWAQSGGTGRLTATGDSNSAGIGGSYNIEGGIIKINGGVITANGGSGGAGIGVGGADGYITINGGTVTAAGGLYGAGIGGGFQDEGGNITISGGMVTATGGIGARDIGPGDGASGGTVTITGGSVNAANISPAPTSNGSTPVYLNTLTIGASGSEQANAAVTAVDGDLLTYNVNGVKTDGNGKVYFWLPYSGGSLRLTATVGERVYGSIFVRYADNNNAARLLPQSYGALIDMSDNIPSPSGTNWNFTGDVYTIQNGADVTVIGSNADSQRRLAVDTSATNVKITLDNVTIEGLGNGQSPLKLNGGASVTLTLTGTSTLTLTEVQNRPGINVPVNTTLIIDGAGSLTAKGGNGGAGIGGDNGDAVGSITINGGTVTANGGNYAAGIGVSNGGAGGSITINGGTVTANGGQQGAGIGGGNGTAGGDITISGGTVTATGGTDAQDIGNGANGSGGTVKITGGSVKAANISPAPTNGVTSVYLNTLTIGSPGVANAAVTAVGGALAGYGINDVVTDGNGKVYFWLTETADDQPVSVTVGGNVYQGTYTRAADNNNAQTLRILTAPTITTASLPDGTEGTAYSATLTATGDTPITWIVSNLPDGLSLSSGGVISGTPTSAGTTTFTVTAANGKSPNDEKQLSITINAAPAEPPPPEEPPEETPTPVEPPVETAPPAPYNPPAPAAPEKPTIPAGDDRIPVEYSLDKDGKATVTIDENKIREIIADSKGNVVLDFSKVEGVKTVSVPPELIAAVTAAGKGFEIALPDAALTFIGDTLTAIGANLTVEFSVTAEITSLDPLTVELGVSFGDTPFTDFGGGTVSASIAFTPPPGIRATQICVYYRNAAGELELISGVYNAATKSIDMTLRHFSEYVVKVNDVKYAVGKGWYDAESLDFAVQRGLVKATNGIVEPTAVTSRAEFVVSLMKALGIQPLKKFTAAPFADTGHLSAEYRAYLRTARELGIISGVGGNRFDPDSPALREQYFQIAANIYAAGLATAPEAASGKTTADFADGASVPAWAVKAVNELIRRGVILGDGKSLQIGSAFNNATTAVMLARLGGENR